MFIQPKKQNFKRNIMLQYILTKRILVFKWKKPPAC